MWPILTIFFQKTKLWLTLSIISRERLMKLVFVSSACWISLSYILITNCNNIRIIILRKLVIYKVYSCQEKLHQNHVKVRLSFLPCFLSFLSIVLFLNHDIHHDSFNVTFNDIFSTIWIKKSSLITTIYDKYATISKVLCIGC